MKNIICIMTIIASTCFAGNFNGSELKAGNSEVEFQLMQPDTVSIFLRSDTLSATAGNIVNIPIYLMQPDANLASIADGIYTEIIFNANILMEILNNKLIISDSVSKNDRVYTRYLRLKLPKGIFTGGKFYIPMQTMLGETASTVIKFDINKTSLINSLQPYKFFADNGLLKLKICEEGGPRLITVSDTTAGVTQVLPNPASEATLIRYYLIEKGYTELNLYNISGRWIECLEMGDFDTGSREITLDAEKYPSGIYYLILKTPSHSYQKEIIIRR